MIIFRASPAQITSKITSDVKDDKTRGSSDLVKGSAAHRQNMRNSIWEETISTPDTCIPACCPSLKCTPLLCPLCFKRNRENKKSCPCLKF